MTHPPLTFHGAARSVTGSCFGLETDQEVVLIDCGLFQGSKTERELTQCCKAPEMTAAPISTS